MGMMPTSGSGSSSGAGEYANAPGPNGYGPSSSKVPLDAAWADMQMQPSRQAPMPPVSSGMAGIGGGGGAHSSSRRNSGAQGLGGATPTNRSAGNSPNLNRTSGAFGQNGAGSGSGGGSLAPAGSVGNGVVPPARPSRAGTMPLDGIINSMNGFHMSGQPSPGINAGPPLLSPISTNVGAPSHPGYTRAPASNQPIGSSPTSYAPPPPLAHQPFSAPSNPYAAAQERAGVDEPETMIIEDKDLPDRPKGRERSGTTKSRDGGGKKSVFGFMTGVWRGVWGFKGRG